MKTVITTAASVALAAAGIALTFPAVSNALPDTPGEWDIGAFDRCENSGGVWDAAGKKCVAPPAKPAEAGWTRDPGRLPVGVFEPMRPTTQVSDVVDAPVLTAEG